MTCPAAPGPVAPLSRMARAVATFSARRISVVASKIEGKAENSAGEAM